MAKILLVEDDLSLANLVCDLLKFEGYTVEHEPDGLAACKLLSGRDYDLLVFDVEVPGMTGFEILRNFRQSGGETPALMLTGKNTIEDKVEGLDIGADDYLTKPFEPQELTARVRALLRRFPAFAGESITIGDLSLNTKARTTTKNGKMVDLDPREFSLLEFFLRNQDQVFAPEYLLSRIWGSDKEASTQAVAKCVARLRKKIDDADKPSYVRMVYGQGYVMDSKRA